MCIDAERAAGENHKVGVLARLDRADPAIQVQHLGGTESQGLERRGFREPAAHRQAGGPQQERDSVTESSVLIASLTPAFSSRVAFCSIMSSISALPPGLSGMVSETGILRLGQLGGNLVGLGAMLEHDLETKLLGEADNSHDVVGPMRMEMDGPLAIEHLDQ